MCRVDLKSAVGVKFNRLLEDDTYTYAYDNNGNLTSKVDKVSSATTTYQYDGEDRLTQVTTPTDVIQYQYDGLGRRNVRMLNGVVTKYVYDQEDLLFEFDENEQIKARYTHGPGIDEPISVDRDTDSNGTLETTYYYQYDGLGSITAITDTSGNVVQTYVYDTFGKIVQQTGSVENAYTYTGREWDAEAGLYYYRARYYDPTLGRFINGDPIGFAGGDVNFYVYVQNSPVNFVDPFGLHMKKNALGSLFPHTHGNQNTNDLYGLSNPYDLSPSESGLHLLPCPEAEAINEQLPKAIVSQAVSMGLGSAAQLYKPIAPVANPLSLLWDLYSFLNMTPTREK